MPLELTDPSDIAVCAASHDGVDHSERCAVFPGECRLGNPSGGPTRSEITGLSVGQGRARVEFSGDAGRLSTPFLPHVVMVVSRSSEEQMIRPYARRVVASVQYPQAVGNRAVMQFPGNSRAANSFAVASHLTVPTLIVGSGPDPAPLALADVAPKAICQRLADFQGFPVAGAATVSSPPLQQRYENTKRRATYRAGHHNRCTAGLPPGTLRGHHEPPGTVRGVSPRADHTAARVSLCRKYTSPRHTHAA